MNPTTNTEQTMITINGRKYAQTEQEFTGSLFQPGGTCDGYAKVRKGQRPGIVTVHLFTPQNKLFAAFGRNTHGEFIVSAHTMENGQNWYMYTTTSPTRETLGIPHDVTISAEREIVEQALKTL